MLLMHFCEAVIAVRHHQSITYFIAIFCKAAVFVYKNLLFSTQQLSLQLKVTISLLQIADGLNFKKREILKKKHRNAY